MPHDQADWYWTLAGPGSAELKVQRSRFLAEVAPAPDETAARAVILAVTRRYHDCRHVCYAWRLGIAPDISESRNDAGEPSGTAGEPILQAIRREDLTCCVAVVARYFGGVKLGTGGLGRAYGEAARLALDLVRKRQVPLGREFMLRFGYATQKTVTHLLDRFQGRTVDEQYGEQVAWRVWLPNSLWQDFGDALREATAANVALEPHDSTENSDEQ